jgi:predicted  nucleic acid-binding Zn-ribbon protein
VKCIKCGHVNARPTGDPLETCPACGVIYAKAQPPRPRTEGPVPPPAAPPLDVGPAVGQAVNAMQRKARGRLGTWLTLGAIAVYVVWRIGLEADTLATPQPAAARPAPEMSFIDRVHLRTVNDAVDRFEMTVRHGSPMDRCVQAGMVVAALLQAKWEEPYAKWRERESQECLAAGIRK